MCSAPSPPKVVYQGPSKKDIRMQEKSLQQYEKQMMKQQNQFQKQLRKQIQAVNEQIEESRGQVQEDTAAAAAAVAGQQTGAYAVSTSQAAAPVATAETTEAITKKDKPSSSLRISTAALPTVAGTGLNIGV